VSTQGKHGRYTLGTNFEVKLFTILIFYSPNRASDQLFKLFCLSKNVSTQGKHRRYTRGTNSGPVTNFSGFSACQKMWVRKENIKGTPVEPIWGQWPTFQAFLLVKKCEYARKTWEVHPWDQFWGLNIHYMIFLSTNKGQWPTFQAFLLVKKCEYKWKTWEVHP